MRLKFVGISPVEVPELGQGTVVEPGQIVDAPDDIGARMAESDMWQPTTKSKAGGSSGAGEE